VSGYSKANVMLGLVSMMRFFMRLPDQKKAQARNKGYDEQSHKKDTQKWQGSSAETEDGLFESEAGNEEIHPYGWCGVTDLKVGEEDDTKV
jgi:hypothetical protein